jgi:hypothetical protein
VQFEVIGEITDMEPIAVGNGVRIFDASSASLTVCNCSETIYPAAVSQDAREAKVSNAVCTENSPTARS